MLRIRFRVPGLWVLLAVAAGTSAQEPVGPQVPDGITVQRDLEYVAGGDSRQRLDLYLPAEVAGPRPVVVWIHGGAWRGGSKEKCPALFLTTHGYAVASIGYRLSQQAHFPAQIEDCKAAVRWLRAHAAQLRLDPDRMGVWGASAGGHLATMLGTAGDVRELEGPGGNLGQSSRVQCVVDYFGRMDLLMASRQNNADVTAAITQLLGGPADENPEQAGRANPIRYIRPVPPPFLIVHGDRDPRVPLVQSELLVDALQKAGGEVALHVVAGGGHGGAGFDTAEMRQRIAEFFDRHLVATAHR